MLNLIQENGKTYCNLSELKRWAKNPKYLMKEDHDRLVEQILDLGQYKPVLILGEEANVKGEVIPEGTIVGGNSRYEVYKERVESGEMVYAKVWVSVLKFSLKQETGQWFPVINGELIERRAFSDPLQIMIEYSQSDNDQAGKTDRQALAELVLPYQEVLPMENYKIQVFDQQPLKQIVDEVQSPKDEVRPDSKEEKAEETTSYIVIKYTPEQFKEVEPKVTEVKELMNVENNTDMFNQLLDFYLLDTKGQQIEEAPAAPTEG